MFELFKGQTEVAARHAVAPRGAARPGQQQPGRHVLRAAAAALLPARRRQRRRVRRVPPVRLPRWLLLWKRTITNAFFGAPRRRKFQCGVVIEDSKAAFDLLNLRANLKPIVMVSLQIDVNRTPFH